LQPANFYCTFRFMNVQGKHYRTIWAGPEDMGTVGIIDQRKLPHSFEIVKLESLEETAAAIREMWVRGAGLIGAAAGFGMYLAARHAPAGDIHRYLHDAADTLMKTRPTASNLGWAVKRQLGELEQLDDRKDIAQSAFETAQAIADEDAEFCRRIGEHGVQLIEEIYRRKGERPVEILTHCNAGWLAFVDYGTATAPVYAAHDRGIPVHVWVDETRPRNQGAGLTAWELGEHGVPHDVIVDNAGGHLMQHGMVDVVFTGADRITAGGDAANKIGTYLKALAARDNGIPFYIAFPSSTIDWEMNDGVQEIPIEERSADEVRFVGGMSKGEYRSVLICPEDSTARNWGFDVTPSRLITGFITERGICTSDREGLGSLYPEFFGSSSR